MSWKSNRENVASPEIHSMYQAYFFCIFSHSFLFAVYFVEIISEHAVTPSVAKVTGVMGSPCHMTIKDTPHWSAHLM